MAVGDLYGLCVHALLAVLAPQVLLLSNINVAGGLANGTRGVVEGFVSIRDYLKQVSCNGNLKVRNSFSTCQLQWELFTVLYNGNL